VHWGYSGFSDWGVTGPPGLGCNKLRRAMVRSGRDRLAGWVEVDETYLGGPEEGVVGRGVEDKALVVIAAQTDGKSIVEFACG